MYRKVAVLAVGLLGFMAVVQVAAAQSPSNSQLLNTIRPGTTPLTGPVGGLPLADGSYALGKRATPRQQLGTITPGTPSTEDLNNEMQMQGSSPNAGAARRHLKYCKEGVNNFGYFWGSDHHHMSMSAQLWIKWFCHKGRRVSNIHTLIDQTVYGGWTTIIRKDGHITIDKRFYNYRGWGPRSGFMYRMWFKFRGCYEPSRNWCPRRYVIYLRDYVHSDGTFLGLVSYRH